MEGASARPDRTLYYEAKAAQAKLQGSPKLLPRRTEWERVVLRFRSVVARYPQSPYCDDALLAAGDLYRQMATRFKQPGYKDDALKAYRTLVQEYPSSSQGEKALYSAFEIAAEGADRQRLEDAAKAYLAAFPDGARAGEVRAAMKKRAPEKAAALPATPRPGLAQVFNLRSWSGPSSTRVVIDLEKEVKLRYDRIGDPDRLWVDLVGTRLHPNLTDRVFPVGDGLLEQVRVGQNRDDVVRVVLDFKDVKDHQIFFLQNPTRLVVDVLGSANPAGPAVEDAATAVEREVEASLASQPPPAAPTKPEATRAPAPGPSPEPERVAVALPAPPVANRTGSYSLARQLGLGARRIVIDPGHGGHDPGTIGRSGLQEKDLVLDVATRLERLVREELGAEVVMTRASDVFVELPERTAIANTREADLFLSIHANSSRNSKARGIETYFLSFAKDPHAEEVAARENAIASATLKDLQGLVKAITLNSKIDESRDFAASVHEALVGGLRPGHTAIQDRGVRTAPFYVLIGANMPSILAEIAFVSNPEEEKLLKKPERREQIARSLLEGVKRYLDSLGRAETRQLTQAARGSTVAGKGGRR